MVRDENEYHSDSVGVQWIYVLLCLGIIWQQSMKY